MSDAELCLRYSGLPFLTANPAHQSRYIRCRIGGRSHDESLSFSAYMAAPFPAATPGPFDNLYLVAPGHKGRPPGYQVDLVDESSKRSLGRSFEQQVFYWTMRKQGQSHNMAELLALRKFPGVKGTDSQFMAGTHCQDDMIDRTRYEAAQSKGVDTNGKRYLSSLARYPNDPEAWVSGLSDVRRVVTDRGWNCSGAVDYSGFDPSQHERPADTPIARDIVEQHVSACLAAYDEGERSPQLIGDIQERVTQELTGQISFTDLRVDDYENPFDLPGMQPD